MVSRGVSIPHIYSLVCVLKDYSKGYSEFGLNGFMCEIE